MRVPIRRLMSLATASTPPLSRREYKGCKLLYDDEYMMALDKPSGMCSVSSRERLLHFNGTGYTTVNGVSMPPKRSIQWVTAIETTIKQYRNHTTLYYVSNLLASIALPAHIPRKQKPFFSFLTRTLHLNATTSSEEEKEKNKEKVTRIWECLTQVDRGLYEPESIGKTQYFLLSLL